MVAALASLPFAGAVDAQSTLAPRRPTGAGRIVRAFDFEEIKTNPGAVPRYWFRAQDNPEYGAPRPGFPHWNRASIVYADEGSVTVSGEGSIRLPTAGGSTSLVLESGVIPIFRQADYFVSGNVLTEGLFFAHGCIAARFLDASGTPVPGTERRSELVQTVAPGGPETIDPWQEIGVVLVGDQEAAAYIQIELLLLQPEQASPASGGERPVWRQDVSGSVWFDEVAVVQLPRVELTTNAPGNVAVSKDPPALSMAVRDLTGDELKIEVRVVDSWGVERDRLERMLGGGATENTWTPSLTSFGWYRAVMDIVGADGRVGGAFADFVWIPPKAEVEQPIARLVAGRATARPSRRSRDSDRFGINVTHLPAVTLTHLPGLVKAAGTGRITVPAWESTQGPGSIVAREPGFVPMLDALLSDWQDVTISLGRVPEALAAESRVPTDDPLTMLLADERSWLPYLSDLLDRYGQRVRRWQVGRVGDDRAFWRGPLLSDVATLRERLARHISGPLIDLPSRLDRVWSTDRLRALSESVALTAHVPRELSSLGIAEALSRWAETSATGALPRPELTLVFDKADPARVGVVAGPSELIKRAVRAWAEIATAPGAPISLEINEPWSVFGEHRPQIMPRPELAAWTTAVRMLGGRRVVGTYPIADGIACYILGPAEGEPDDRGGALVVWNEASPPDAAEVNGFLGDGPLTVVDMYGNQVPLRAEATTATGRRPAIRLKISDEPLFIEGIDVELTRFISGFEVRPVFLESTNQQHERTIRLINPWDTAISGRLTILEPGGFNTGTGQRDRNWRVSPRTMRFSAEPRQTIDLPFTIAFSPTEEQGPKEFVADVELTAEQSYGVVTIKRSLEVGLRNVVMDMAYALRGAATDQDVVVETAITNTGDRPLTLELTCFAPGLPRSKGVVSELKAGHQVVKRFTFPGASTALRGKKIVISASDPEGTSRLNKSLVVQ